jgi:hypothetical protein
VCECVCVIVGIYTHTYIHTPIPAEGCVYAHGLLHAVHVGGPHAVQIKDTYVV